MTGFERYGSLSGMLPQVCLESKGYTEGAIVLSNRVTSIKGRCGNCGLVNKHRTNCKSNPKNPLRKITKGKFSIAESGKWKPRSF